MMETFSVSTCPACLNWCLMDDGTTPREELEGFLIEHLYDCFGVTELMEDLPWSA